MKKLLNIALIMIILASGALQTKAQTLSADKVKNIIENKTAEQCSEQTGAKIEVRVIALPFRELNLPDGKVDFVIKSSSKQFLPRDLKRVSVYVNNNLKETFNAPVEIKAYKEVLVATELINRDRSINSSCAILKKMQVAENLQYALDKSMLDKDIMAKKNFSEGEVIDARYVKMRPDVERNSDVTAYFRANNLLITINAVAMSDGMLGDYIGIRNQDYKKVYRGKIIGENKVLIEI